MSRDGDLPRGRRAAEPEAVYPDQPRHLQGPQPADAPYALAAGNRRNALAGELSHGLADAEHRRQRRELEQRAPLTPPGGSPAQRASPLEDGGHRQPARRASPVAPILIAERGPEHRFLVAHDRRVFKREPRAGAREKPLDSGYDAEAGPDEEVPEIQRIARPGEWPVSHEPRDHARPSPRLRPSRGDAPEPQRLPEGHEERAESRRRLRQHAVPDERHDDERNREESAAAEQPAAHACERRVLGGTRRRRGGRRNGSHSSES